MSKRRLIVFSTLIFMLGTCGLEDARADESTAWPSIYRHGPTTGKYVALTFDDAPMANELELLDVLDGLNVKATFFVVGTCADDHPELLIEIVQRGHEIGSHSWDHPNMTRLTDEELVSQYVRTNLIIRSITGVIPHLFRPPGGNYNSNTVATGYGEELVTVLWTANSGDYTGLTPSQIANRVLGRVSPGGIILLHDGVIPTQEALPVIVNTLRSRGYTFVTVGEMLSMTHDDCQWEEYDLEAIQPPLMCPHL
jgi:peptidoglycan/xylan/chitin deacetylase (PgdA/CDA1 family)